MKIGIIDSGKGGLAVLEKIQNQKDHYLIIMDHAYFPYGNKTKEFLCKRAYYLVNFLIQNKVDLVIIACNTLSIATLPFLKSAFKIPILGVFSYLIPYMQKENLFIGSYIATKYVQKHFEIKTYDATNLIAQIEAKEDVNESLKVINNLKAQAILLGCTHFLCLPKTYFNFPVIDPLLALKEDIEIKRKSLICNF